MSGLTTVRCKTRVRYRWDGGEISGGDLYLTTQTGLAPIESNLSHFGLFKVSFSIFWLWNSSQKVPDLSHFEPIWPYLWTSLTCLPHRMLYHWTSQWSSDIGNGCQAGQMNAIKSQIFWYDILVGKYEVHLDSSCSFITSTVIAFSD